MNKKSFYAAIYSFAGIMTILAIIYTASKKSETEEPEKDYSISSNEEMTEIAGGSALYADDYSFDYDIPDDYAVNSSSDKKIPEETTVPKPEVKTETTDPSPAPKPAATVSPTPQAETESQTAEFDMFDGSKDMVWPVNGKIVMDYSIETSVYDKTLDQYRTNDSISIAADVGTPVSAAADGIVENIFHDHNKGNCIVINHGNGWLSTYGQLQTEAAVAVGQVVDEGQVIGKIAEPTAAESMLGPHLLFMVSKDNIPDDPKLLLAQLDE